MKQFKVPSPTQESILAAFEEEGWPAAIDDPLPPQPEQDSQTPAAQHDPASQRQPEDPAGVFPRRRQRPADPLGTGEEARRRVRGPRPALDPRRLAGAWHALKGRSWAAAHGRRLLWEINGW